MAFTNFLNTIGQIAGPAQNIFGAVKGYRDEKRLRKGILNQGPTEQEKFLNFLYGELAKPDSAYINRLTEQERTRMAGDLSKAINEQVLANRRERSLGRAAPFFDPERADETQSYILSRAGGEMGTQARGNVIENLLASAKGMAPLADAEAQRRREKLNARTEFFGVDRLLGNPLQRFLGENNLGDSIQSLLGAIQGNKAYFPPGRAGTYGPYQPAQRTPQSFMPRF
jgi:hypothetical protein